MSILTDILSAPVKGVLDGAADIISKFVKDPTEALKAQVQLSQMDADLKIAMVNADQKFADSQAQVIEAEAKSDSWLARNWRPILMMTFTTIIANNYLFASWFNLKTIEIPLDMWALLKIGIGGYIMGRSVEKFLPDAVSNVGDVLTALKGAGKPVAPVVISSDYFSKISDASLNNVLPKE